MTVDIVGSLSLTQSHHQSLLPLNNVCKQFEEGGEKGNGPNLSFFSTTLACEIIELFECQVTHPLPPLSPPVSLAYPP